MSEKKRIFIICVLFVFLNIFTLSADEIVDNFNLFVNSLPSDVDLLLEMLPTNLRNDFINIYNFFDIIDKERINKVETIQLFIYTNYIKVNIIQKGYGSKIIEGDTFTILYNTLKSSILVKEKESINALGKILEINIEPNNISYIQNLDKYL